ncbi:hypothetical protein ACFX2J_043726 [Malus domestica]
MDITQPCVCNHHNESLLSLVIDEEIWDTVCSLGALKAPGPDGLSAAFFHGRAIQDNILNAHEMFAGLNRMKGRTGAMGVKLDLEKAYDYLNWDYIQYVLLRFGFDNRWVELVWNVLLLLPSLCL